MPIEWVPIEQARKSKSADAVRIAHARGYRTDESGRVFAPSGRERKLWPDGERGYLIFSIRTQSKRGQKVQAHQLQAFQVYGEDALREGVQVRHLNGDKHDNSADNIAIGTPRQNQMDKPSALRRRCSERATSFVRKLTEESWQAIMTDRRKGMSLNALRRKYGLAKSTLSYVVNRKTYRWARESSANEPVQLEFNYGVAG